jgi:hypothetical protein
MPMAAPYDPLNPINNNIAGGMQQSLMNNFWYDSFVTNLIWSV